MARIKKILFIVIVAILFLPIVQQSFTVFRIKPLQGSYLVNERPVFSFHDYFTNKFQTQLDPYLEQNLGFRPCLVRLNNQIAFSLFRITEAKDVVIGKDNYLFENNYIRAYTGADFQGIRYWDDYAAKLKMINDTLDKNGTCLVVIFAPGKATFFPEYLPGKYQHLPKDTTNQEYLLEKLSENNIRFIDVNHWFTKMKPTSPYPLYPKTGIHWSNYGEALALDSLIRYMEKVKNRKMVDFGWEEVEMSDDLRVPDKDIADGMNLLFNIGYYPMPYPKFHFNEDPTTYKPVVITVTDSYYWNLHGRGITQRIYSKDKFWYYFQTAHGPYPAGQQVNDLDILAEVESADFIVLMATDANLYKFDFGFAEKIFGLIQDQQKQAASKREARIKEVEQVIRGNAEWMKAIREKAAKQGIPFDEMIRLDAIWMIENQKNGNKQ